MSELIRRSWDIAVRGVDLETRSVDVIASTDTIDSYGEVLVQDWDLERYLKNPVVLWGHNSYGLPIGHASNVRVEKKQLLATLHFVDERANPLAEQVWQGFVQKSIRAVSVGFRSDQGTTREIDGKHVYVLSGNRLVEISAVAIGANEDAVAVAAKSMDIIRALVGASTQNDPQEQPNMINVKTILALLALPDTAIEADVVDKVKALERRASDADARALSAEQREKGQLGKVLEATGVDSFEKALGAIAAGKSALADLGEEKKKSEQLERAKLIGDAKAAKKLTPAQEKALEGQSLDFVRSFIELQHPNPALKDGGEEEPAMKTGGKLTHDGKAWTELKPSEKHALYHANRPLYEAMRDAAAA